MPAQSKSPYYFKSGWRRSGCSQFAKHDDIARYCEELATKTKACEAQILSLTKELQRANTQLARLEEERFEFAFENEKAALVCSKTFMTLPMPAFDEKLACHGEPQAQLTRPNTRWQHGGSRHRFISASPRDLAPTTHPTLSRGGTAGKQEKTWRRKKPGRK